MIIVLFLLFVLLSAVGQVVQSSPVEGSSDRHNCTCIDKVLYNISECSDPHSVPPCGDVCLICLITSVVAAGECVLTQPLACTFCGLGCLSHLVECERACAGQNNSSAVTAPKLDVNCSTCWDTFTDCDESCRS